MIEDVLIFHLGAGNTEVVKILVENGADVDARDMWKNSALLKATWRGNSSNIVHFKTRTFVQNYISCIQFRQCGYC